MIAPIYVIGSSRSGTSLMARILTASGIFMGADVESNHESRSLQAANRWVLSSASAGLEAPERVDLLLADPFVRRCVTGVLREQLHGRPAWRYWGWRWIRPAGAWGFKDPRTTFTLPLWLDLHPNARVVHMLRHGADVALSLHERRQRVEARWPQRRASGRALVRQHRAVANLSADRLETAFAHWQQYVARASDHVARLGPAQATTVRYEALVQAPAETCARLAAFLDHPVTALPIVTSQGDRCTTAARRVLAGRHADLAEYGY